MEYLIWTRRAVPVVLLALLWAWETWQPFFGRGRERWRHAGRNLALALVNSAILGVLFGSATVRVADWTRGQRLGLLNHLELSPAVQLVLALLLLDGWMYLWHRANHAVPLLWRFHRVHHSDPRMDVTTATRFHLGELAASALLRLGLIPLLGFNVWHLIVYETLVLAVTQLHHADISLGRCDRWLNLLIVTPDMHKVHHSNRPPETNSNYSTVLPVWDRLARSFRRRDDPRDIVFGLEEFTGPDWQTFAGMWKTPFTDPLHSGAEEREQALAHLLPRGLVGEGVKVLVAGQGEGGRGAGDHQGGRDESPVGNAR